MVKVPCEVITKVVGYARPVNRWNNGKLQEWKDRAKTQVKSGGAGGIKPA
jgi:anaerobic ribonucleoside-triphosphate reductase